MVASYYRAIVGATVDHMLKNTVKDRNDVSSPSDW